MKELVKRLRTYYQGGNTRDISGRIQQLRRLKEGILKYEQRLEQALWEDLHKSAYESYLTEISIVLQELNLHIRNLRRWAKPQKVTSPIHLFGARSRIIYEPLGVVLIIAPWNYPVQLLLTPLVGAIAAGNCVVLKPSPDAPQVANVLSELLREVFMPDLVSVVQGGREVNQALLAERFDHLFFTGSPEVGKVIMRAAAEYLTPVTLELGGKSPCIVGKEADLKMAARRIIWGKCLNAGQTCVAPDYLLVQTGVKKALFEYIRQTIQQFYGQNPEKSSDYPRIVRLDALKRLAGLLKKGDIVYGGEVNEEEKYIAPTVLENIQSDACVMQEEIFGPILPIIEFEQIHEAIDFINGREKPLALYYFGKAKEAEQVLALTSSGGVCVNDTILHIANPNLPFGGVGRSGIGRYHGKESFCLFSNRRSILYAPTWWDIPFRFPPYRKVSVLKKLPGMS